MHLHDEIFKRCILTAMNTKYVFWTIVLFMAAIAAFVLWPYFTRVDLPDVNMPTFESETVRAPVTEIIEDGEIDLGEVVQRYQVSRIQLLEGKYQGIPMEMDYGKRQILSSTVFLDVGDQVLVMVGSRPDGVLAVYFADFVRSDSLLWLTLIFVVVILIMSRWKGLRSLLSLVLSLLVIIGYIIPHILAGEDPLDSQNARGGRQYDIRSADHRNTGRTFCLVRTAHRFRG